MDEEDYIQRSEELLKDDSAYQSMEDNPVQKIYNKINGTVNKLVKAELLTKYGQWRMRSNEPIVYQNYTN